MTEIQKPKAGHLSIRGLSQQCVKALINSCSGFFFLCVDCDQMPQCLERRSHSNLDIKGGQKCCVTSLAAFLFLEQTNQSDTEPGTGSE